jgi:integrase
VKASTLADYKRSIVALGWLDRKLASVKPTDVRAAYEERRAHATSAGRIFRSVRSVWNAARANHPSPPPSPTLELKSVRKRWATAPRKQRVIPDALLPAWRKQVDALDRGDVRDYILTMHFSGMRDGEARALTVEHINLRAGTYTLIEPKNGHPIELPVTRQLLPILRRRIAAVGSGPLFPFGDVRKSYAAVNSTPWSPHDLRRGFITLSHRIAIDDLFESPAGESSTVPVEGDAALGDSLQRCERYFIPETLERHGWQIGATARALGISRKGLWERMRQLAIAPSDTRDN